MVLERDPDSLYQVRGVIGTARGVVVSVGESLTPDHPTSVSLGEMVFALLERLGAQAGGRCQIVTSRQGIGSGQGVGDTYLQAKITCGQAEGNLGLVQGSDPGVSHEMSIQFLLRINKAPR